VELYAQEGLALTEEVDFVQAYVKMPGLNVSDASGQPLGVLCTAAVGDSFAAGTTDGPGMFDFTQSANSSNPLWHFLVDFLHKSTKEEKACQSPKGILLPTGDITFPYPWAPSTLSLQIFRLGQFVIIVAPTELTTMAGRRLRDSVREQMISDGALGEDGVVVIAGLANGYADYTTTFEEYQAQRYEGASTIFGPHQHQAYTQEFRRLAHAMATKTEPHSDPAPSDFSAHVLSEGHNPSTDHLPSGADSFGQVLVDAEATYAHGAEVAVTFAGSNALNDMKHQGSFMKVEKCSDASCTQSSTVAVDGDWETRVSIQKVTVDLIEHARKWKLSWFIPTDTPAGLYRIVYEGVKCDDPLIGKETFTPFTGMSKVFTVQA